MTTRTRGSPPTSCERVDAGADIVERVRPSPAVVTHPAVLEVPCRPAVRDEVDTEPIHQVTVVAITPEASVDDDRDAYGGAGFGKEQLGVLTGMSAVGVDRPHEA